MKRFNLPQLITRHNQEHPRKRISPYKTWGLTYLSPEGISVLNTMLDNVVNINTNKSLRTQVGNLDNYRQSIQQLNQSITTPEFFRQAKKLCQTTRTLLTASKLQEWEVRQVAWLSEDDNWSHLMTIHPEAKGSLVKLKQFWDKQQKFCCASNDFLLQAMELLNEIQSHFDLAEHEFLKKRTRLPAFVAVSYDAFLGFLKLELQLTRQSLLQTMLSRLILAERLSPITGHLSYDDALVYTIQELQRIGVVKNTLKVSGYWQTLQPQHFNSFQRMIEREGNAAMRKQLSELAWFTTKGNHLETVNCVVDTQLCIVPTSLVDAVPLKKRWPAWLFQNQNRCVEFIQNQQATFANLKLGYSPIRAVDPKERFQRLDHYQQHVETALNTLQKSKPKPWQLWSYFGYRQLLDRWEKNIWAQSEFCVNERIKLLEEISYQELPPKSREAQYQLWLLTREQLSRFNRCLPETLSQRINAVEKSLTQNLNQDPAVFAICLIQSIAENETLNNDELNYLIQFTQVNDLSPEKEGWLAAIKPYSKKALTALLLQTKQLFTEQDTALTSPYIINSLKLIELLSDNDQGRLQHALKQLLFLQTRFLDKEQPDAGWIRLQAIQKLVFEFGDETIKRWLTQIDPHIDVKQWPAFLSNWRVKLKELQMQEVKPLPPVMVHFPASRTSSLDWFSKKSRMQEDLLSISLPLFQDVSLQPQLHH